MRRSASLLTVFTLVLLAACAGEPTAPGSMTSRWWKGNLHTHSFWSDGDDFPEMVVDWYHSRNYQFLAISDHNVMPVGERYHQAPPSVLDGYRTRFGADWVETREADGTTEVRLKTLEEYRSLFEEPGRFLLIPGEEITDGFEGKPIHLNATNLAELVEPPGGESVTEVIQNIVDRVLAQRERTGQPMFPHVNHPNFGWGIRIEDMLPLVGERFFEVYNGHPQVHNEGDELRPSTERMWDILLAERLSSGQEVMYGIAVDDAHFYHEFNGERANPGRAWIMVRAPELTAEAIVDAMEAGDFYGSTGVALSALEIDDQAISFSIAVEDGVSYRTQFIGTRRGYPAATELAVEGEGEVASVERRYSDAIGDVLDEQEGTEARYAFTGDEIYVRAKVISTKLKENPYREGETESAWIQPVVPR